MNNEAVLEALQFCSDVYTKDIGKIIRENDFGYGLGFDLKVQLVESNDFLTITFRGTTGLDNALTDLAYTNVFVNNSLKQVFKELHISEGDNAIAHQGFTRALKMLYPDLKYEIQKNPLPLRLYGHSLGGALASLCAYLLAIDKSVINPIDTVITFGSPRVFYREDETDILDKYNSRVPNYLRFCNQNDIVSFLPFNEKVSLKKINSNDLFRVASITTRFSHLYKIAVESISSLFGSSVSSFTHVGDCYILDHSSYQHIGVIDEGRNLNDISRYSITQYASYFTTKNLASLFIGVSGQITQASQYLTLLENLLSDQEVLNIARKYVGINDIGYEYVRGTLEEDPLFQKLLRDYGNENEIVEALGILQWERVQRNLYQKHLLNPQGGLYNTYYRFMRNKIKNYAFYKQASQAKQIEIIDRTFTEWLQTDRTLPEIIGKNSKILQQFTQQVRNQFLSKLKLKDFQRKVGRADLLFDILVIANVFYLAVWSYFFYEQSTTGVLGHQMSLYKHNYLRFYSRNQQISKTASPLSNDIIQLPSDPDKPQPQSIETPYHHPLGFIYTDRIGSFVLFK